MQKQHLILVAGGSGSRMKSDIPKQFIELNGEPIIIKTLRCFLGYNSDISIVICVHKDYHLHLEEIIRLSGIQSSITITPGGYTRYDSVKNGLNLLESSNAVVGIHDAARPFVSRETIQRCFDTAAKNGNAIPCISVNESMRHVAGDTNNAVSRDAYKIIQTPQCFVLKDIKRAFEQSYRAEFTDDATVLEADGGKINLVEGNPENIKITTPYDLQIAKSISENE